MKGLTVNILKRGKDFKKKGQVYITANKDYINNIIYLYTRINDTELYFEYKIDDKAEIKLKDLLKNVTDEIQNVISVSINNRFIITYFYDAFESLKYDTDDKNILSKNIKQFNVNEKQTVIFENIDYLFKKDYFKTSFIKELLNKDDFEWRENNIYDCNLDLLKTVYELRASKNGKHIINNELGAVNNFLKIIKDKKNKRREDICIQRRKYYR